ncbi:MAG: cupredoxin domain-containing protein [Thermoproteota archaeon]|nr:cupredoxin domain-containing protein [Thermoproteota archaeon]
MIMSKSIMILTTALTTRIAIIVSLAIAMSSVVLPVLFPSEQQQAVAQQQGNNITTNATTPITTTQPIMPVSSNKTFYVFSAEVEGLDEATARIPGDIYTPPVIVVNGGDSVTVNFYNTEQETEERHSFTIDAQPYSVDIDIAGGESGNATFTAADQEGIFPYYCKYHLPTMVGQLVVLPPTTQPEQQQQQEEEERETTAIVEEEQLPTTEEQEAEEQQQQQPLTVTTDRESYSTGDTIVITGTVAERQPGSRVSITVIDPQNEIVWRESVIVTANNTYQLEIEAGERQYSISPYAIDTSGTYLVTASYRTARAETTFEFTSEEGG